MNGPSTQNGFTLLELLLAFVVFALSFAVVLEILSGSMRNTVRARHYSEAALTAQSIMDQVGLEIPLEEGTRLSGDSGSYQWDLEITGFELAQEGLGMAPVQALDRTELLEVVLEVSWGVPPRDQSWEFATVKAISPADGLAR
jgi:general secretion pathway protein I